MSYNFSLYQPKLSRGEPDKLKISKNGDIVFNHAFIEANNLKGHNYVRLFYDRANKVMGMTFHSLKIDDTLKLPKTLRVAAKTFFKFSELNVKSEYYTCSKENIGDQTYYLIRL